MQYREYDGGYLLRFQRGENTTEVFHEFLKSKGIEFGAFSAIGAVSHAVFGFYRLDIKEYVWNELREDAEVVAWSGNVSIRDGEPWAHTHAVFARMDGSTVGGHVREATVGGTLELVLDVLPGRIERRKDEDTGLALLCP